MWLWRLCSSVTVQRDLLLEGQSGGRSHWGNDEEAGFEKSVGRVRNGSAVVIHYVKARDMEYYVEIYVRKSIELIVEHSSHGHDRRSVWQLMPIRRHGWRFSTASS